jgi:hypothetical protein
MVTVNHPQSVYSTVQSDINIQNTKPLQLPAISQYTTLQLHT